MYVVEYRMKKQDGSYIWIHDLGRKIVAENGKPAIASVCIDITAQRQAQEEVLHPVSYTHLRMTPRCGKVGGKARS